MAQKKQSLCLNISLNVKCLKIAIGCFPFCHYSMKMNMTISLLCHILLILLYKILAYSLTLPSHIKGKLWASRKNDKAIKIIIKTQILWWKTLEGKRRLTVRVRVKFFYSILNLSRLTHDVTCSRLCPDGKSMRRQCQMKTLLGSNHN